MSKESKRTPRGVWAMVVAMGVGLIATSQAPAQTVIYDSTGFEPPAFTTGALGTFYIPPATGGQQGWQTTDLAQISGAANGAGQIQNAVSFAPGTQSFEIIGQRLVNDTTFSAQTFWFRNAPAGAINPVGSGTPFVTISTRQQVSGTPPVTTSDMPFVGVYMEGYTAGGTQQALTSVMRNANGGITVVGPGGGAFNTSDNIWSPNTFHNLQVTLNFNTSGTNPQTLTVTLDGALQSFTPAGGGSAVTTVPFRNTNGPTTSIAEYGFQASFNTQAGVTSNNAFFDNYVVTAAAVPEPASILLLCGGAAAAGWQFRRRKVFA